MDCVVVGMIVYCGRRMDCVVVVVGMIVYCVGREDCVVVVGMIVYCVGGWIVLFLLLV